jgi:hypothetical protein
MRPLYDWPNESVIQAVEMPHLGEFDPKLRRVRPAISPSQTRGKALADASVRRDHELAVKLR